jgi:hypothetical protein
VVSSNRQEQESSLSSVAVVVIANNWCGGNDYDNYDSRDRRDNAAVVPEI